MSCCGLSCSCLRTTPIGRDAMGLCARVSSFSSCWWLDWCAQTRRMPIWFWQGAGHKTGLYLWPVKNLKQEGAFLCLLPMFSLAVKSASSVLLTVYRQVWKKIQIGLYFMQHQNGKSVSLAENQSEVWLKRNMFSLVLLLPSYFIHVGKWQIWC